MTLRTNLFVVALALALFGNVMVYSATSKDFGTHYLVVRSAHVAVGVVAFLLAKRVRYTSWRKIAPAFYLIVLASLVLVLFPTFGTEVGGARRWFDLGPVSVQPAEFAKLAAIFLLSCAVARARPGSGLPSGRSRAWDCSSGSCSSSRTSAPLSSSLRALRAFCGPRS